MECNARAVYYHAVASKTPRQSHRMSNPPVIFLIGPTATGKTAVAAALFDRLNAINRGAELVSVDATQVYRGMDIGSAKPSADFLRRYPHHLIDIRAPADTYNAAAFRADAHELIQSIRARGKLPLLVGGSSFYFAALEHGLSELPAACADARADINRAIEQHGTAAMHKQLQRIDAAAAAAIRPSDAQRIGRALEIHRLTGCAPSAVMRRAAPKSLAFPLIKFGLFTADRRQLHARIDARFQQMLDCGLLDEVRALAEEFGDAKPPPALRAVGYRQALAHLRGNLTHDAMRAKGIAATRQLAKRQLTWMRQQRHLLWVDVSAGDAAGESAVDGVCAYLQQRFDAADDCDRDSDCDSDSDGDSIDNHNRGDNNRAAN